MKRYGIEWEIPKRNENGEWMCLGKKYVMIILPEEEKQKYIEKMTKKDRWDKGINYQG